MDPSCHGVVCEWINSHGNRITEFGMEPLRSLADFGKLLKTVYHRASRVAEFRMKRAQSTGRGE
jgi:hypothetical protein